MYPENLVAGERWACLRDDLAGLYPPASYSLSYIARSHGGASTEFLITATEAEDTYFVEVPSATTADYPQGHIHWQAWITRTSDSERLKVSEGHWEVAYDYDVNHDPRTHAEIMLEKIQSLLEGRADSDVANYTIGNRSLTKLSIPDLLKWRDYYRLEVKREEQEMRKLSGKRPGNMVLVQFRRAL